MRYINGVLRKDVQKLSVSRRSKCFMPNEAWGKHYGVGYEGILCSLPDDLNPWDEETPFSGNHCVQNDHHFSHAHAKGDFFMLTLVHEFCKRFKQHEMLRAAS